jgi:type IV pilus assembly protein PilN
MKLTLNLASRPYVNRRTLYLAYAALAAALVLLLILNSVYALRLRSSGEQVRQRLAELGGQGAGEGTVTEISPEAMRKQQENIAFANDILRRDSFRWTRLLDHLEESAVEGVAIRALQPDYKERSLQVKGVARGVDELRRYIDQLMASQHFSEVYLLEQSREKDSEKSGKDSGPRAAGISFSIVLRGAF